MIIRMKVWLIDDEQPCLDEIAWRLKKYSDVEIVGMDTNPLQAIENITENPIDVVFLDIDMPVMDGIEVALRLQERFHGIRVIFVTAYAKYALEAYQVHPLDFLLKPISQIKLDSCIAYLESQFHKSGVHNNLLKIHCFGPFEINSKFEVKWSTHRVRELLLYLIDKRGHSLTKSELLEALFQGKEDKNTIHNLYMTIYRLKILLDSLDPEHKWIRFTENNSLIIESGVCDYIDFMNFSSMNAVITEQNADQAYYLLQQCQGIYLEKESYEWVDESINEVEIEYERIALALAMYLMGACRLQKAEEVLTKLLLRNSLCEEAHTLLLEITLRMEKKAAYVQRYEQYAHIMKKEFHLKPMTCYREQYEQIKLNSNFRTI